MKILFDHNVPHSLATFLTDHFAEKARDRGWAEFKDGRLLTAAEQNGFELMITAHKNIAYQQNLRGRQLSLVIPAHKRLECSTAPGRKHSGRCGACIPRQF